MRARVYSNGGNSTGGFTFNGGQLTGALILAGNPSEPLEAASKQYVDSSMVNLNASNLTSGTLPSARLPSFAGDIVKPAGSSTINLAPNGITAGDYVKPTVDSKGRVTGGSALVAADITNLSWDKITTGRPTTLAGYGINNGISLSGGTLAGFLTFAGSITGNMQAATKQYIDSTLSSSSGIAIGDIIRKPYATTPAGFLKCNGAEISKTTYSSLYSVISDRFSKNMVYHGGQPWKLQYTINDSQSADLPTLVTTGATLPITLGYANAFVTKNRVYICGGYNGSAYISTVYTAVINSDGSLGSWSTGTALPGTLGLAVCLVVKNRVYLITGTPNGGAALSVVYYATINADGTIGSWTTGTSIPGSVYAASGFVTKNRIYILGGWNASTVVTTVYSAPITNTGEIGTWTTDNPLQVATAWSNLAVVKNRVYLLGGYNGSISNINTIQYATINTDGTLSTWSTAGSTPTGIGNSQTFVTKNRIYVIGYYVVSVGINSDGSLGQWNLHGISQTASWGQLIVTKNKLHILGGYNGGVVSTVITCPISGGVNDYSDYYTLDATNYLMAGNGKPWQHQYDINTMQRTDLAAFTLMNSLPTACTYGQAVVTKNRIYYIGKGSGNVVYSAPINADGSLGAWVSETPIPANISNSQAIVTKNRIYLIGGYNGSTYVASVYAVAINADGTLGTWASAGNALPQAVSASQVVITKNRVYVLGGVNGGGYLSTVYTATIDANGIIGSWSAATSLPVTLGESHVVITKNRIYLCGGYNGSGYTNNCLTATINSDGIIGTWTYASNLPAAVGYGAVYVTRDSAYIFGGYSGGYPTTAYRAPINTDGTLGTWATTTALPLGGSGQAIAATLNHVYMIGGSNGTQSAAVYSAPIIGSVNDYSGYYDGTILAADAADPSTTFALPDLTNSEKFDTVSYIKY